MYLPIHLCVFCFSDISNKRIVSCENNRYVNFPDGTSLPSIPFVPSDIYHEFRCPDCNVRVGGFHHPGCEHEICPKCHGTLADCGCMNTD